MSFWDLANGRNSDLKPLADPSRGAALAEPALGMAGGAAIAVGFAFAALAGMAPIGLAGMMAARGVRQVSRSAETVPEKLQSLEEEKVRVAGLRRKQGIRYFERALKLDSSNAELWRRLAIAFLADGDIEKAYAAINQALAIDPKSASTWLMKGTCDIGASKREDARAAFTRATEISPDDPEPWSNLGLVCEQLGDQQAARYSWEKVTGLDPRTPSSWINRGELAYVVGNVSEGVRCWERAAELDGSIQPKWITLNELGQTALSRGDFNTAESHFDSAIRFNPAYAAPLIGKALCSKQRGDRAAALEHLDEVIAREHENAHAWLLKGNLLAESQRGAEANECFKSAFEIDNSIRVPWVVEFDEGIRLLNAGNPQGSIPYFYRATALHARFAEAWFRKGVAHRALGQLDEARRCWESCLSTTNDHSLALLNLGTLEFESGARTDGVRLWKDALQTNPRLAQAALNVGAALADEGHLDEAMEYLMKADSLGHPRGSDILQLARKYNAMDPAVGPRP